MELLGSCQILTRICEASIVLVKMSTNVINFLLLFEFLGKFEAKQAPKSLYMTSCLSLPNLGLSNIAKHYFTKNTQYFVYLRF